MNLNNRQAFTLIELIVVMAIIAVLVLLAAPKFLGYTKDANVTAIKQDERVLTDAIEMYHIDNGQFPIVKTVDPVAHGVGGVDMIYNIDTKELGSYIKDTFKEDNQYGVAVDGQNKGKVFYLGEYNYGLISKNGIYEGRDATSEILENGDIILNVTQRTTSGLYIKNGESMELEPNTTYKLTFSYQKMDGNLLSFGGHVGQEIIKETKVYIDDVLHSNNYADNYSAFVDNDDVERTVDIVFTTTESMSTGNSISYDLWIQPNRGVEQPVSIKTKDLELIKIQNKNNIF